MALIPTDQAEIERTITKALSDVSRPNPLRLKAGLRILMTTDIPTFEKICSPGVQKDLHDFKKLLLNPEAIASRSIKTEEHKQAVLDFIKQYTLSNLSLLDNRTAILPNTHLVKKSVMEGEHLKSVVHVSALSNVMNNAHYFDLLEKKFKEEGMPATQINSQIEKAFMSTQALHNAVLQGNISEVLQSLSVHGVDVNFPNEQGMTPLHLATRAGLTETVKVLLTVPGIQINTITNNGWTALHMAARMGHADIVDALLSMPSIDPNRVNSDGWSALHWAAWHGFTEIVSLLLRARGILVNLTDRNGTTPLHLAARNGHPDVIAVLFSVPKFEVNLKDNEKRTALHMATIYSHESATKMLLSFPHTEVNHPDIDGLTPLHWAARNGHMEILKALLAHPNILRDLVDNNGMTAYDWAVHNGHISIKKSRLTFNKLAHFFKKKIQQKATGM